MKYLFLYKTTHIPTGRFYIGIHETSNLDDDYLGSGIVIQRLLAKYPRSEFNREILCFCKTREELSEAERQCIQESYDDVNNLNIALGGDGGPTFYGIKEKDPERYLILKEQQAERVRKVQSKGHASLRQRIETEPNFAEHMRTVARKALKKASIASRTPEAIAKKKEVFARIGHQQGEKNSSFGKHWIHKGTENKLVPKTDLVPEGWEIGRKIK